MEAAERDVAAVWKRGGGGESRRRRTDRYYSERRETADGRQSLGAGVGSGWCVRVGDDSRTAAN